MSAGYPIDTLVKIGRGRTLWRVKHSGLNSYSRILVESVTSGREQTVRPDQVKQLIEEYH